MEQISTSLSGLISSVEPALQKLSELFCVSLDVIKENGMEYILMYGQYHLVSSILNAIIFTTITLLFTVVPCLMGFYYHNSFNNYYDIEIIKEREKCNNNLKHKYIKYGLSIYLGFVLFITAICLIPYLLCEEIYSIQAVISLIQPSI